MKRVRYERRSHLITFEEPDRGAKRVLGKLTRWLGEREQDERKGMEEGAGAKRETEENRLVNLEEWRNLMMSSTAYPIPNMIHTANGKLTENSVGPDHPFYVLRYSLHQ